MELARAHGGSPAVVNDTGEAMCTHVAVPKP